MDIKDIKDIKFLHFLTVTCLVELFILILFKRTIFTGPSIHSWYTKLRWSALILDLLSVLMGFYIAKFIYEYLLKNKIIDNKNTLLKFLAIVLAVQITHDFLFYFLVIKKSKMGNSLVMDEFKLYAKSVGVKAVAGDSFMYIIGTPLLFYLTTVRDDVNVLSSIVSLYLLGYLIYEKPKYLK